MHSVEIQDKGEVCVCVCVCVCVTVTQARHEGPVRQMFREDRCACVDLVPSCSSLPCLGLLRGCMHIGSARKQSRNAGTKCCTARECVLLNGGLNCCRGGSAVRYSGTDAAVPVARGERANTCIQDPARLPGARCSLSAKDICSPGWRTLDVGVFHGYFAVLRRGTLVVPSAHGQGVVAFGYHVL